MLLCGLLLLTVSIAVLNTLVPLWLTHAQLPTWQVGVVSSSYFTGNLLGTLVAGKLIKRIGFTRSYHLACLVFAFATMGMVLSLIIAFVVTPWLARLWMKAVPAAAHGDGGPHTATHSGLAAKIAADTPGAKRIYEEMARELAFDPRRGD